MSNTSTGRSGQRFWGFWRASVLGIAIGAATVQVLSGQGPEQLAAERRIESLKAAALQNVERQQTLAQQMVDSMFSFAEVGFQEVETSRYLVDLLRRNGFRIEESIAGIPTAFIATWGSGKPVIALGSDLDGVPQTSQKPGVAYREPLVEGAPGHGEGHNSGQAVNIVAALAVKALMERERIPGTLMIFPGIADELDGSKAYFVRAGVFKDVDAVLFSHVSSNFSTRWGAPAATGSIDVLYTFKGESSHSAIAPWRGRSALDAVELTNIGWNFRREHLRLPSRVHYVIPNGGDMPNVVPSTASVWYYFRETEYPRLKALWELGDDMARAAATMAGVTLDSITVTGEAYPTHHNRTIAETMFANIARVGLPSWSEADESFARALQTEVGAPPVGLATEPLPLGLPVPDDQNYGGGSSDLGAVMWTVPTAVLSYPANIATGTAHHWANAAAMATPIAHKGTLAGARVQALTLLDFLLRPELIERAWTYLRTEQAKSPNFPYRPLIRPDDRPATWLNRRLMEEYRPQLRALYYDPARYKTYLDQLGITYPRIRR